MNIGFSNNMIQAFIRYKRTDLKWYQKFWNIISGHKDRNFNWIPVKSMNIVGDTNVKD